MPAHLAVYCSPALRPSSFHFGRELEELWTSWVSWESWPSHNDETLPHLATLPLGIAALGTGSRHFHCLYWVIRRHWATKGKYIWQFGGKVFSANHWVFFPAIIIKISFLQKLVASKNWVFCLQMSHHWSLFLIKLQHEHHAPGPGEAALHAHGAGADVHHGAAPGAGRAVCKQRSTN